MVAAPSRFPRKSRFLVRPAGIVLACTALAIAGCQWVEKPARRGTGPLSLTVDCRHDAPPYHLPLERWRRDHMNAIVRYQDFTVTECRICHQPERFCDRCHNYLGAPTFRDLLEREFPAAIGR
ncbi:MAG: hypothetical protein AB1646_17465 [Thermodesulfobacteriota bacterium]